MKTTFIKNHTLAIFTAMLFLYISSCGFGREKVEYFPVRYFLFDPKTLLELIDRDDPNPFTLLDDIPPDAPQPITVNWKQFDYIKILKTLFNTALKDDINDWQLNSIGFSLNCDQYNQGFQEGNFKLFKIGNGSEEVRMVRTVNITAWNKTISVKDEAYTPKLVDWSAIDLVKTNITGEGALKIADQEGGSDARLAVGNNCRITVNYMSDSIQFDGWWVRYDQYNLDANPIRNSLLEMEIDPLTGKSNKK